MKKKNLIVSLMLSLALFASAITSVSAFTYSYPGFDGGVGKLESVERNIAGSQEQVVEKVAYQFNKEVAEGKYKLISTDELKADMDAGRTMVIVDTMGGKLPAYNAIHIKGAIETWAPLYVTAKSAEGEKWNAESKQAFLNAVKAAVGTKTVTKYYNKKTKKWTTTKPAKKNIGKTKKATVVNKSKKVVVYCGFVGCGRSHEGAKLLVENGYTSVYRYGGGISAWFDAGFPCEGEYVAQ